MAGMGDVRDLRFEGMDIPELRRWIGEIKGGRGPESMDTAARALEQAVQVVVDLDDTLRRELGKLRIDWEGYGGAIAQEVTQRQQEVLRDAQEPLKASTRGVQEQGRGYSTAKNGLPNAEELQHRQSENAAEWFGGAFGYESDYDEEAKRIDGQKKAAQAALGSYRDTTVRQVDAFRPLPEMAAPALVTPQSAGSSAAASIGGGSGETSASGSASSWFGESGWFPDRDGDDSAAASGHSGAGVPDDVTSGSGPGDRPLDREHPGAAGGTALGIVGGATVAGAGALAAGRLLGGSTGMPETPTREPAPNKAKSSGIGDGPGDTTAGRSTGRPAPGSFMAPAATRGQPNSGEDDGEHDNEYFMEETHFDDNRLVAPPVLGEVPVGSQRVSSEAGTASDDGRD